MVRRLIQGIAFLTVAGITELSLSCPQSTFTIDPNLQSHQKSQTSTVAFAWTGAHYLPATGTWEQRGNSSNTIVSRPDGSLASQSFLSSRPHSPTTKDASSASASAQCTPSSNCQTASLSTSACVTSKVDSAGAGAYARAGITVPPRSSAAKTGTVMINIPSRMTLTSNVGDETGAWGIAVSVTDHKSLVDQGHLDVAPFLVDLLGLKDEKQFKVHSDKQRIESFVAGFELNPQGTEIKLIGPDGAGMTAVQKSTAAETLDKLRKRFVIRPCQTDGKDSTGLVNKNCHTAEYLLEKEESISIETPYEFPQEPETSKSEQILFIEVGHAGRDHNQERYGVIDNGSAGK